MNCGKGNYLFPNYNYVLQKQTFGIPKLQVKAKNVKALLDEPFLQVTWRRLLRKQFLNPNPLKDPPHAMQCTWKAEKPPCKWKRTHLHPGGQIRKLYSLLCGTWESGFSYPLIFYVQLRHTNMESWMDDYPLSISRILEIQWFLLSFRGKMTKLTDAEECLKT